MPDPELVPLAEAAKQLGIHRATLLRRVKELGLPTYRSQLDLRQHLLNRADLTRLRAPMPTLKVGGVPGTDEYESYARSSAGVFRETGVRLDVLSEEPLFDRVRSLAKGSIDTFTGSITGVCSILEAGGEYATADGGPFPIRDWLPFRLLSVVTGFVVNADGPIRSVWDIRPGMRIADVGRQMPAIRACYLGLLAWVQLDLSQVVFVPCDSARLSLEAMRDGRVDIAYASPISQAVFDLERAGFGLKWLDLNPSASERDREGATRHRKAVPTLSFVQNRAGPTSSIGLWGHRWAANYWGHFIRAEASDDLVHSLATNTLDGGGFGSRVDGQPLGNYADFVSAALPDLRIPVHEGAVACFRERGLWTADNDQRQAHSVWLLDRYIAAWREALAEARARGVHVHPSSQSWQALWDAHRQGIPSLGATSDDDEALWQRGLAS